MNLLLPVDSRVSDIQGFMILKTNTGEIKSFEMEEQLSYNRRGFRGGCVIGNRIYVCNSFSVKIYTLRLEESGMDLRFDLMRQVSYSEWTIGRRANADLHMLFYDPIGEQILLANTYMDCVDTLSLDGDIVKRTFLWEISPAIEKAMAERNPKAPDLCHLNHIGSINGEIVMTLGNINGTGKGVLIELQSGNIVVENLHRPHDGVHFGDQFFITEATKSRMVVYDNIKDTRGLRSATRRIIDLAKDLPSNADNRFWVRGLHVTDTEVFVGCSQFQDRNTKETASLDSHVVVIERSTLKILDKLPIPSIGNLRRPVVYSMFNLDAMAV